ncbi:MAG TPA: hypothetical protein EYP69_06375 [Bacteroidales bacterium]|nr:hypothetical protein [Bacteroidales bacterium]
MKLEIFGLKINRNMKVTIKLSLIVLIFFINFNTKLSAQRCDRMRYGSEYYEDYDFRMQSVFMTLLPGDTTVVKTVVYAGKAYRIFAAIDDEYPPVHWKITAPYRVTVKKIKAINHDTTYEYKRDEYGEIIYDEDNDYQPIVTGMSVDVDTVFESLRIQKEKLVFDSKQSDPEHPYWEKIIRKTRRLFIYVYMPTDIYPEGDCANVYIGRKFLNTHKTQSRYKKVRIDYY